MRRMRAVLLGLSALLLLLAALLWMLPAEVALRLAAERLQPLRLEAVSGTVWNGRALDASLLGRPLGALRWQLRPLPLLGGALDGDILLEGSAGIRGGGSFRQSGEQLRIADAQFDFPARLLEPALDLPALALRGTVALQLQHALLRDGLPVELAGSALWRDAAVAGAAAATLGDIAVDFATAADGGIAGTVQDRGGPLLVQGTFRVAFTGYRFEATLRARDGNPQVREALAWVGRPQPDGSVHLLVQGQLLAW